MGCYMFVHMKAETNYCGEHDEKVVEFPDDITDNDIELYVSEWADENAISFGELGEPENDEDDQDYRESYSSWDKLEGTREEIEEEYGEISAP